MGKVIDTVSKVVDSATGGILDVTPPKPKLPKAITNPPSVLPPAPTPPTAQSKEVQKAAAEVVRRAGRSSTILTSAADQVLPAGSVARKTLLGGS